MTWVAVAVAGAAVVGGVVASKSANKAANAQKYAADAAQQVQWDMYNQSREDVLPQIQAAQGATNALWGTGAAPAQTIQGAPIYGYPTTQNALTSGATAAGPVYNPANPDYTSMGSGAVNAEVGPTTGITNVGATTYGIGGTSGQGIGYGGPTGYGPSITIPATAGTEGLIQKGPGPFKESEGYLWTLGQGLQAQQRQASATGRLGSGAYIKDATKYAEGLASTEYDNFLRRYYQSLEPYFTMMTGGTRAASSLQGTGTSTANALSALQQYSGNAQAAGALGSAYPWTQLANAPGESGFLQNSLRRLFGNTGSSGYDPSMLNYGGTTNYSSQLNPWGSAGSLNYGW